MNQLVRNLRNIPIQDFAKMEKISKVSFNIPKKAHTFDAIKVIKDTKTTVDIITFFSKEKKDKPREILKRYIVKSGRLGKEVIEKKYIKLKKTFINGGLNIAGKKVISKKTFEGENFGKTTELRTVTELDEDTKVLHIAKVRVTDMGKEGVRKEAQSLFEYRNGMSPKGYKILNYFRTATSFLTDIFAPYFVFKNISKEKQEFMKNDPFLFLHLYPIREFKKMAPSVAVNPEHKPALPFKFSWYSKDDKILGICNDDIKLNQMYIKEKPAIISIAAHENEHVYQKEQALFYAFKKGIKNPKVNLSKKKIDYYREFWKSDYPKKIDSMEDAKMYYREISNYKKVDINNLATVQEYSAQNVEKQANEASLRVEDNYYKSVASLREEFPYAPLYLIDDYLPLNEDFTMPE